MQSAAPALLEPIGLSADTVRVTRGDVVQLSQFEGIVTAYSEPLWFEETGAYFKRYNAAPGDIVREGDILAELDTGGLDAQIDALRNELEANEEQWRLYPASGEYQLKTRAIERERLEYNIKALENKRSGYMIAAPFDGVISRAVELYAGIPLPSARATVLYISDLTRLAVECSDSGIASKIAPNSRAVAVINSEEYNLTPVKLTAAERAAYLAVNSNVPVRFESADGKTLPTNGSVQLRIYGATRRDVLLVPANSLHSDTLTDGGVTIYEDYVYLLTGSGGERVRTTVTAGLKSETVIEIISGVSEGDSLFIDNAAAVKTDAASLPKAIVGTLKRNVQAPTDITFAVTETITLPVNGSFTGGIFSGTTVAEGDVLASFTVADNIMAQREAKINLEMAEALPNNAFAVKRAREYYEQLVLEGTDFDITSPIAGYVRTYPRSGAEMYRGQPYASVNSLMRVQLKVTGSAAEYLKYGTEVTIHPILANGRDFLGHVSAAGSLVRLPGVETYAVIDFDVPGEFAEYAAVNSAAVNNTRYEIRAALEDISGELLVPRLAVKTENTYKYVTVLENGLPRKRFILTGLSTIDYVQVLEGIEPGAALVY